MYTLYIKTHNKTGLKYLGYTKRNPYVYKGSGKYWKNHINVHNNDVTTEIIKQCKTLDEIKEFGLYYSELWNVVESDEWANLAPENGRGGFTTKRPDLIALNISRKGLPGNNRGSKRPDLAEYNKINKKGKSSWNKGISFSEEVRKNMSEAAKRRHQKEKLAA